MDIYMYIYNIWTNEKRTAEKMVPLVNTNNTINFDDVISCARI